MGNLTIILLVLLILAIAFAVMYYVKYRDAYREWKTWERDCRIADAQYREIFDDYHRLTYREKCPKTGRFIKTNI